MAVYIFVLHFVLYCQYNERTLDSFMPRLYLRYKKGPDLNLSLSEIASSQQSITINFNKRFFQENHQFTI